MDILCSYMSSGPARSAEFFELGRRDPGEAGSYKQHQAGWPSFVYMSKSLSSDFLSKSHNPSCEARFIHLYDFIKEILLYCLRDLIHTL